MREGGYISLLVFSSYATDIIKHFTNSFLNPTKEDTMFIYITSVTFHTYANFYIDMTQEINKYTSWNIKGKSKIYKSFLDNRYNSLYVYIFFFIY